MNLINIILVLMATNIDLFAESENDTIILLDVRTQDEWNISHIEKSILIPVQVLKDKIESKIHNKDQHIVVYCARGIRSKVAFNLLREMGYKNVEDWETIELAKKKLDNPEIFKKIK